MGPIEEIEHTELLLFRPSGSKYELSSPSVFFTNLPFTLTRACANDFRQVYLALQSDDTIKVFKFNAHKEEVKKFHRPNVSIPDSVFSFLLKFTEKLLP